MTEIFNLHTLCRCCHRDGCFKSLELSYACDNRIEVYSTMLQETFNITISPPSVEASHNICDICIQKLRDAVWFKEQVLECEQKFEEYCKNEQALILKEELNDESSSDSNLDKDDTHTEFNETADDEDSKGGVNVISYREESNLNGNVDEKCYVQIKDELIEAKRLKTINEIVPIEYNCIEKPKALISEKSFSKTLKAGIKRRKHISYRVDSDFELHMQTSEGDAYICKLCDKKYRHLKLLRNHILKQHKDAYKCQICSLQCVGRIHYLRHSKTHTSEVFKCQFCGKSFKNKHSLAQHVNVHTQDEKFQCDMCHKFFAYKQTLRKHLLWHYGANKTCMCDVCGHAFNDKSNLRNHIQAVHEKQRPFKCPVCPKTFTANKHLKLHSFVHTGEKPYKCEMCFDQFVSPWKLKHHQYKYHSKCNETGMRIKLYTCKICKMEHESRGKFMAHLKTHIGQKEYKCHLCPKDFTCKYSLNRHINEHSGIKAFACDMCSKKYTQQSQLCRHKKQIHDPKSDNYPGRIIERVKCDICNKSFRDIKKHIEAHNKRPHACDICLKSYPERNTLNRHILYVHHGLKPHPCTLCDKKYAKWSGLQKHSKRIHKLELKRELEES